jgi:deaminated glutathione amidase
LSYGQSTIISPWGEVLAELGAWDEVKDPERGVGEPQIAVADINLGSVEKVRMEMPLLRRTDVYHELP